MGAAHNNDDSPDRLFTQRNFAAACALVFFGVAGGGFAGTKIGADPSLTLQPTLTAISDKLNEIDKRLIELKGEVSATTKKNDEQDARMNAIEDRVRELELKAAKR